MNWFREHDNEFFLIFFLRILFVIFLVLILLLVRAQQLKM